MSHLLPMKEDYSSVLSLNNIAIVIEASTDIAMAFRTHKGKPKKVVSNLSTQNQGIPKKRNKKGRYFLNMLILICFIDVGRLRRWRCHLLLKETFFQKKFLCFHHASAVFQLPGRTRIHYCRSLQQWDI